MSAVSPTPRPLALDTAELRAWRGMLRVHASLTRELDAQLHAEHGLGLSAYEVLMFVGDADGQRLRMSDIADRVLLSRSGLTRLVDRLVAENLLERSACADDARGAFAELTPVGRRRLDAARATHLDGVRRLFLSHLSDDDRARLAAVWERVLAAPAEGAA